MLLEIKDLVYEASDRVILNHINLKVDKGGNHCNYWSLQVVVKVHFKN